MVPLSMAPVVWRSFAAVITLAAVATVSAESIVVGDVRVSALSPTLLRIEPRGPKGFENRSTFNVVGRDEFGKGIPIQVRNTSASGTWLSTDSYDVFVPAATNPVRQCQPQAGTDANDGTRLPKYPMGTTAHDATDCCSKCTAEPDCVAWTFADGVHAGLTNCWPFSAVDGTKAQDKRTFGMVGTGVVPSIVASSDGRVLWNGTNSGNSGAVPINMLHWPSPGVAEAYAFEDRPRFTVPPWGPTPIPANATVAPGTAETNGYDFTNDVAGDTYVFLLGDRGALDSWWASRGEFLQLTGPTPLLPDFAYGVWYTWYISYTETRAKHEIGNWTKIGLPLDVWALDMNWREIGIDGNDTLCRAQTDNNPLCRDHFYDYPNLDLMPGLASPSNEWFNFIKRQNLKTYFNDHPFPVANQTTPKEVGFRYGGLSEWIGRGLSYFWFDHNWGFTLPGPLMPFNTKDAYEGLSGQVWGSHVYYESTKHAYTEHGISDRPIALSRDNGPNWRTPQPMEQTLSGAGSPAHHRFPVWWTGDGVPLLASVESMVNEAVHDFRAFVHSDCGGHGNYVDCPTGIDGNPSEDKACPSPNNAALLRWTAHCVLGTVVRFHQGDHRFWLRDEATQTAARSYLTMRHSLAPSLISAGQTLQKQGFPLTARCDLLWPTHTEASDPTQYVHLNATLVAPLDTEPVDNVSNTRSVWIPPGDWIDGWTGATVTGPKTVTVTQPSDRIPMWHKSGSLLVMSHIDRTPGKQLRVVTQEWNELIIEAFPDQSGRIDDREIYEQDTSPHGGNDASPTVVSLSTDGNGSVSITVSTSPVDRSWLVRLHLRRGQRLVLDAATLHTVTGSVQHLEPPSQCSDDYFPFKGEGAPPPCLAGPIAEFRIAAGTAARSIQGNLITTQ